ncbi:MAG: hypothetical protein D6761_02420 [Candidatus Dadabacteria bacterium]|nr:MAG: hypothetical protein D6761_02420 [Candidatus Dadabacteria bacterium]
MPGRRIDIRSSARYHVGMMRVLLIAAGCAALFACGSPDPVNTTRQGMVALTVGEAWSRVRDEWQEARDYALCDAVNEPCAAASAYVRTRPGAYWFALHRVAGSCSDTPCEPDVFNYFEVDELGTVYDRGTAVIEYGTDGFVRQIIGEPIWNMPELDQPKQPLLSIQSERTTP